MQEMKSLAQTMREAVASIKQEAQKAVAEFKTEHDNSKVNLQKVKTFTNDLRQANKEVEAIIGAGSNFPPLGEESSPKQGNYSADGEPKPVDRNGVTVNKG